MNVSHIHSEGKSYLYFTELHGICESCVVGFVLGSAWTLRCTIWRVCLYVCVFPPCQSGSHSAVWSWVCAGLCGCVPAFMIVCVCASAFNCVCVWPFCFYPKTAPGAQFLMTLLTILLVLGSASLLSRLRDWCALLCTLCFLFPAVLSYTFLWSLSGVRRGSKGGKVCAFIWSGYFSLPHRLGHWNQTKFVQSQSLYYAACIFFLTNRVAPLLAPRHTPLFCSICHLAPSLWGGDEHVRVDVTRFLPPDFSPCLRLQPCTCPFCTTPGYAQVPAARRLPGVLHNDQLFHNTIVSIHSHHSNHWILIFVLFEKYFF